MNENATKGGWGWAYRKIRSLHASRGTALFRATLYWLRGDSGSFSSHGGWGKSRIRRN